MTKINWIKRFEPLNQDKLLKSVYETIDWLEQYSHLDEEKLSFDVLPGSEVEEGALLLSDKGLYGGGAGIALFYLRVYVATKEEKWLDKARKALKYVIDDYKGIEIKEAPAPFLGGAEVGFLNGPAGGAYVASLVDKYTGENRYEGFVKQVTEDVIASSHEEDKGNTWYGFYGMLGEGGLILYLIYAYETYKDKKYLEYAIKTADYVANNKEVAPQGGYRWYVMPTDTFPTIGKAGGYFPGFEYGAAGCGYLLAKLYEITEDEKYLEIAKGAAEYILNVADYSEDNEAALVRYNDTYLTDLYYLGVCQGPIGTSRLFYELYRITNQDKYKDFIIKLTNGILAAGAPSKHSEGYWRTNCYCCGAAGMLEHFINVHKLTGEKKYLDAAYEAAETLIGESTVRNHLRNWYTAWNRHEPETSDPYIGLYHGTAGCASSLLSLSHYIGTKDNLPPYLEDPYQKLYS